MSQRDEVFSKFGPLLLEAFMEMWLDELNEIRADFGKQPRTKEYILGKCHNNLNHLAHYDWMEDET